MRIRILVVLFFCFKLVSAQTTSQETFGQNRVQYKDVEWSYYETEKFKIFFYPGGQELGKYVVRVSTSMYEELQRKIDLRLRGKINILVYTDLSDANQSNIGLNTIDNKNTGGTIKIVDNKLFIHFDGNHAHLNNQIKEGLATLYMERYIVGASTGEILQNMFLLNLPLWFQKGLPAYLSEGWTYEHENRLRDGMLSGKYSSYSKLSDEDPSFLGQAIWNYVQMKYGIDGVKNLLYYTRRTKNVDNAFLYATGKNLPNFLEEWYQFNKRNIELEATTKKLPTKKQELAIKKKNSRVEYSYKISPDGKNVAFISNDRGKYFVYIQNLETNKKTKIHTGGIRSLLVQKDYNYPLINWSAKGDVLGIIDEKRDQVYWYAYNIQEAKKEASAIEKFQRIYSFSFTPNKKQIVVSASQKGQTDIYLFNVNSQSNTKLTNDYFDDLNPVYYKTDSVEGVLFSSNRTDDTLCERKAGEGYRVPKDLDIFFYDLKEAENQKYLGQVSSVPISDEKPLTNFTSSSFFYTSSNTGIQNIFEGTLEKYISHYTKKYTYTDSLGVVDSIEIKESENVQPLVEKNKWTITKVSEPKSVLKWRGKNMMLSNYSTDVLDAAISAKENFLVFFKQKQRNKIFLVPKDSLIQQGVLGKSYYRDWQEKSLGISAETPVVKEKKQPESLDKKIDESYFFQTDFDAKEKRFAKLDTISKPENTNTSTNTETKKIAVFTTNETYSDSFQFSKVKPYQNIFYIDNSTAQFGNTLLIDRYQVFNPQNPVFQNAPFSPMFSLGAKDLFENYRITGGARFPFTLNGSEFFGILENLKKRTDKKVSFYRRSQVSNLGDDIQIRTVTNYIDGSLKFVLDEEKSIQTTLGFRNDKVFYRATDLSTLSKPKTEGNWLFLRSEYVIDNTIPIMLNIQRGSKIKFYAEVFKDIPVKSNAVAENFSVGLPQWNNGYFLNWGVDARHYIKVHKNIIWANRVAYSTSIGTRKMIYYLGGVEGQFSSDFDRNTQINNSMNYAFQTIATSVRGFSQNTRNGNNYALFNSELRFPVFSYLAHTSIRSDFVKNFQLVGFVDGGAAWTGWKLYDEQLPAYSKTFSNATASITANYQKDPFILASGFGARTTLLGYFMRLDFGWGYDSGKWTTKPKTSFSLSLDF